MECLLLPTFVVLAFGVLSSEGGTCPENPSEAIQACARKVQVDLNTAEGHKFITDPEYTKKMCEGEEVNKALTCMEAIYKDCTKDMDDVEMLIKPSAWKEAIQEICDNKKYNKDCFLTGAEEMQTCVQDFQKKAVAEAKLESIDLAAKGQKSKKKVFQILCGLSEDLMTCFDKTLVKNCPPKMEKILDDILHKFLPPVCHPADDKKTSYETVKDKDPENGAVRLSAVATMSVAVAMCLRSMI